MKFSNRILVMVPAPDRTVVGTRSAKTLESAMAVVDLGFIPGLLRLRTQKIKQRTVIEIMLLIFKPNRGQGND
uniref:Structural maintenance of chromosomes protein 6B-like isoform X3 n=1 Tax=Rhizophora mucronata TaxID=61149 RepID=A0A2P2KQA4_RHIMU